MTQEFRGLIHRRQKALANSDLITFRSLRNQVNRERKSLRTKFYEKKVRHLKSCEPATWWKEVKRLCGMSEQSSDRENTLAMLHNLDNIPDSASSNPENLANLINQAFLAPMSNFTPLPSTSSQTTTNGQLHDFHITEFSVFKKLAKLNPGKAGGPDGIPSWVLKENADLLASPISNILNCSFHEARVPQSWKHANIIPIPKEKPVRDVNKHLRPISLTPIVSKLAEDYVVSTFVKPAVLKNIDPNQYGTVPKSSTTQALVSMLHSWNSSTDGNGATTRIVLFDFKKAFDLIDHHLLIAKLATYEIPQDIIMWITDFLSCRKQRVKLSQDCCSEWELVPAGVPQGTKLGPWLYVIMINDWGIGASNMWKYVDDTSIAETIEKGNISSIQDSVDDLAEQALANKFQMNQSKCKELRIGFAKSNTYFEPIKINDASLDVVNSATILGLTISHDLKWNEHVSGLIKKARKRLYFLSQLKRSHLETRELTQFYITCIRPITEYACPVFHDSLTKYLSHDLEMIQKRAMRIIFPWVSYSDALSAAGLQSLGDRRQELTDKLFQDIVTNNDHKLHSLLLPCNYNGINLRQERKFNVSFKTQRYKNDFISFNALKM